MPRRKGHGIPPTKRVKPPDAISRSAPLKNKLYNDIPVVAVKEEPLQMTVNAVPIKSDPPSIISEALHSKYLHKKFKKMASTLLPEENNQINTLLNGRIKSRAPSEEASPKADTPPISNAHVISPPAGRYVCSYCKLACAKPSVLQKHIRAHTNERPYPCMPCGFAFKTKSNLYKHCRSRAHASKLEETGEKPSTVCESEEFSSDEDGSLSSIISNAASATSRVETDPESKDDVPKLIYKPKYRFMEPSVFHQNENALTPPRLHLKIPVPNSSSVISTPSPFTSGSSPSPEFLQRHISKLISENQAIVETNDPFWSKKFLHRTNSSENSSPSPLSTSPSPADVYPVKKAYKQCVGPESAEETSCDKLTPRHSSKLALALLRPQSSDSSKFPITETFDAQPLNLSTGSKDLIVSQHNRKRSYSESIPEKCSKLLKDKLNNANVSHQVHNNLVQDSRLFASSVSENGSFIFQNHLDVKRESGLVSNSQNPEGSIIKDLLLKSRAAASPCRSSLSPSGVDTGSNKHPESDDRSYSPSSQFMCHLCKEVGFRDVESLETHQMYHCMGNDMSSRSSLGSPSPHREHHQLGSYRKSGLKDGSVMTATPYPSPGPLLGSTPLVDSYRTKSPNSVDFQSKLLKKRKFDSKPIETRVISATTLRSLEELSKCPMRSNVHMFGGEVKILDTSGGETKTLRIDSTNKNSKTQSEMNFTHCGTRLTHEVGDVPGSNLFLTFAKQGLHSSGSTVQQQSGIGEQASRPVLARPKMSAAPASHPPGYQDSKVLMAQNTITPNLIPGLPTPINMSLMPSMLSETPVINPLTNITAYNPLTLPPASMLPPSSPGISPYSNGIFTIFHGGKEIPHVPGMPGPHSLLHNPSVTQYTSKLENDKKFFKSSEGKMNNLNDQYSRVVKNDKAQAGYPGTQKPSSLNIPTIQVNNEMMSNPGEMSRATNLRKRSTDENSGTKRNHLLSLPVESESSADASPEKRFLRPSSLPLKPGTFVPKRQPLGTPVLSLVSPETPRPRKSYGQLYLNGHAYTYLGLKCSTRMFFCTLNKPQPIYVPLSPDHNKISMYSNWKVCTEADPNPYGLDPGRAMTLYDSRHRPATYTLACSRNCEVVTHSSYWTSRQTMANAASPSEKEESAEAVPKRVKIFAGGFESNEDYIYVRGRGRGRYVCEECGIRCKKPSMLKKHIRTHTDVRPFTCIHCKFSFKTKGNLTKHMKSKAHFKKCADLGITPVPTVVDDSYVDEEALAHQQALRENQGIDPEETEDEEEEEDEDTEDEDDYEEGEDCLERLAAQSLLTLSETIQSATQRQQASAGLVAVSGRPSTYPYSYSQLDNAELTDKMEFSSSGLEDKDEGQETVEVTDVCQTPVSEGEEANSSRFYFPSHSLEQREPATTPQSPTPVSGRQPTPMDLSNKPIEKTSRACEAAMLLATLCSTMERLPIATTTTAVSEDSTLLQAYLTERAVQDSRIKQQQYKHKAVESEPADGNMSAAKENALGILAQTSSDARKHLAREPVASSANKPQAEFLPPSSGPSPSYVSILEDGRSMCNICNKVFSKPSQLRLHVNIHYFERPYRCESCAVSFRTRGHLQKHQRSVSHLNKVSMNSTFGTATTTNPRPFKCDDCKIAFRIHGHLAKHLRSKMHIMKLECLGKLPFGTYAEMERSGVNMNEIDTTDCENSLESLQLLARKLYDKDPSKLGQWDPVEMMPHPLSAGDTSSEAEDEDSPATQEQLMAMQRLASAAPRPTYSAPPELHKGPRHKPAEPRRTDRLSDG